MAVPTTLPTIAILLLPAWQHKDMNDVVGEFPTKSHADIIEFYYNWKFHEPDYSRWQFMKRQIDIALVSRSDTLHIIENYFCLRVFRMSYFESGMPVKAGALESIPRLPGARGSRGGVPAAPSTPDSGFPLFYLPHGTRRIV